MQIMKKVEDEAWSSKRETDSFSTSLIYMSKDSNTRLLIIRDLILIIIRFNSRLPQPKYCFLWSVQTVVDFIRKKWERNQELSDKFLIYKLTMLMALTSASHALGLQHLSIRFMAKTPNSFTFFIHKLHKAWKKGKSPPVNCF